MTATKSTAATFAVQIAALCGDRASAALVRQDTVRTAIVVALKGNASQWLEGAAVASKAKGSMGKALSAGFQAVGAIAVLIKPQEAVTAAERAERIAARADELAASFEAAVIAALPAEKTAAEKDAAKSVKAAAHDKEVDDKVTAAIKELGLVPADTLATDSQVLARALSLIIAGKCGTTLADELRAALGVSEYEQAAYSKGKAAALAELSDKATGKRTAPKKATAPALAA